MKTSTQTVEFNVECYADIEAIGYLTDYGVPGSPRWWEWEPKDFGNYTVDIAGVTVKLKELPEKLRLALWEAAVERVDDDKWETFDDEF